MTLQPSQEKKKGRVVPFRPRSSRGWNAGLRLHEERHSPVEDLSKYLRGPEEDSYRQRVRMNLFALLALAFIVGCGIWLANNISPTNMYRDCGRIDPTECVRAPAPPDQP